MSDDGQTSTRQELEARLERARAARVELETQLARREEERELLDQVEQEERAVRDAQAVARVEEEHGPIDGKRRARIDCGLGVVIVKRPNHLHYKRFRDTESAKSEDIEKLVRPCLLHPDAAAFDRILEEEPAMLDRVANAVVTLAGFKAKEVSGK